MSICLIAGLIKRILVYKKSYYLEPNCRKRNKVRIELNLPKYATKSDTNKGTSVDKSKIDKKSD